MHITRLVVEELRAIDRLELDLRNATGQPRRRTILLGVNGAGKTTTLDAIVHAFCELAKKDHLGAAKLGASDVRDVELPARKKKLEARRGTITMDAALSDDELREISVEPSAQTRQGPMTFSVGDAWDRLLPPIPDPLDSGMGILMPAQPDPELFGTLASIATRAVFQGNAGHAIQHLHPACIFLPADRGILEHRDDLTLKEIMAFESCSQSLSRNRSRFAPIAARLALAHNAPQTDEGKAVARMWKVLAKYFVDLPKPVSADNAVLRFRNKSGAIVPLSALSDGERAILLIFAELALRAPTSCVVLIDEIEQHLHPRWQREILAALLVMAPLAQFIITTQSPYLAACAPDDVIKLPGWEEHGE
ncbi:MAG TPA: AAA family ATPase [Polyangium sp.]|nr:AAA family ATPase [Polyangium sp.]